MNKYPVKRRNSKPPSPRKTNNNGIIPLNPGMIPNIFKEKTNNHKYRKGRVNCESVEQIAIYIDSNGNKVMLRKNTVSMNADSDAPGLSYTSNGNRIRKKRKY